MSKENLPDITRWILSLKDYCKDDPIMMERVVDPILKLWIILGRDTDNPLSLNETTLTVIKLQKLMNEFASYYGVTSSTAQEKIEYIRKRGEIL